MVRFLEIIILAIVILVLPGIAAANLRQLESCKRPIIPVDDVYDGKWGFNANLVATAFGPFAAASFDAYMDYEKQLSFLPADKLKRIGWHRLHWNAGSHRFNDGLTGLVFDTYYKTTRRCTFVIVAVRGTDGPSLRDAFSNAYLITRALPVPNQYRAIKTQFANVRAFAEKTFGRGKVVYVATGHSLGGGLSIQLAKCFDRVSAVVFDSSFVEGDRACRGFAGTTVVEIYDKHEILSRLRAFMGKSRASHVNNANLATYGINPYELKGGRPIAQHGIIGMALGLLRAPLDCMAKNAKCEIKAAYNDQRYAYQHILLCDIYARRTGQVIAYRDVCVAPRPLASKR
ncbi:hypothetical protein [Shinella kummerowiae]|uniref:hypothetical protein n=1 Tax=Shinella kummerowiae TaxID=417745 RepID=UPI0021B58B2C|nr:hypothetical protein [Shinella kummerowiae]MCT7663775.1 hypothetical protein [Shinella kummerowiae]